MHEDLSSAQPLFNPLGLTNEDKYLLKPFFTNLDKPVFTVSMLPPEVIGALCSRASRAKGDLRTIFLEEFVKPFLEDKSDYSKALREFIDFLHTNPTSLIFSNPKGRDFYIKWLAQYGDDSIAQMAGSHLVFSQLSLVAIKHFETMRVGIAPIEKSTRYVDYSEKINGHYLYYTDPKLKNLGLYEEYERVMDMIFDTYTELTKKYGEYLTKHFPDEKSLLIKTKTFDTVRGILPLSTLSQVAFFANGQAFEYAISRSLKHPLAEVRWAGQASYNELSLTIPSFVRRLESDISDEYQSYLSSQPQKAEAITTKLNLKTKNTPARWGVRLLEYDPHGENKVIAGFLYPYLHQSFDELVDTVTHLAPTEKDEILKIIFQDRTARWYKTPRSFEHAQLTFEVTANWGVWKDLQRHRMLTEQHELFSATLGYEVPVELEEAGLDGLFREAVDASTSLYQKIAVHDIALAQYAVTQTHYHRFIQRQNLRSFFWEAELRTIAQGHPDYRKIEQEKVKLVRDVYPHIGRFVMADMTDYTFARRGSEESTKQKEKELQDYLKNK
ncbi:FAD-dependent thymidylate synthase [candidate division WWE3 bacterium]|uniref:FAD-dependent thymidylate synthase n=1 Tax=candidate division WWE3 bacterium TaxID=2053526 RepID=A0A955LLH1_UNCKA|nr:FAD-dependent thymidylate synthase [candidate division WWE3 bacterium]